MTKPKREWSVDHTVCWTLVPSRRDKDKDKSQTCLAFFNTRRKARWATRRSEFNGLVPKKIALRAVWSEV